MTIDKTIDFFKGLRCGTLQAEDARDVAISTMRKYQKIKEIVQSKTTRVSYDIGFRQIKEVVEDGNNNDTNTE